MVVLQFLLDTSHLLGLFLGATPTPQPSTWSSGLPTPTIQSITSMPEAPLASDQYVHMVSNNFGNPQVSPTGVLPVWGETTLSST